MSSSRLPTPTTTLGSFVASPKSKREATKGIGQSTYPLKEVKKFIGSSNRIKKDKTNLKRDKKLVTRKIRDNDRRRKS
jgi:hypothetical protein